MIDDKKWRAGDRIKELGGYDEVMKGKDNAKQRMTATR
jgi:hypothetical protein